MSPATVSRALNANASVDAALAERVRAAADRLDYRPSRVARNLRAQSSTVWGFVAADIGNPFFTRLVRATQDAAWRTGRTMILCNTDEDLEEERRAIESLVAERVGGVIIAPASETETNIRPLLDQGIPVVAVDRLPAARVDAALTDNFAGGVAATRHLIANGAITLGCITGPLHATTARQRLEGFRSALADAGRRTRRELVVHADFREDGARRAVLRWVQRGILPDGIFVTNNLMTLGVLQALEASGLSAPEDVELVGFDELPWAGGVTGRIPVVTQAYTGLAQAAVRMLDERVRGFKGAPRQVVVQPQLVAVGDAIPSLPAVSRVRRALA